MSTRDMSTGEDHAHEDRTDSNRRKISFASCNYHSNREHKKKRSDKFCYQFSHKRGFGLRQGNIVSFLKMIRAFVYFNHISSIALKFESKKLEGYFDTIINIPPLFFILA